MKFKCNLSSAETLLRRIRNKLPNDLVLLRKNGIYGSWWEIRPKGGLFRYGKESVTIDAGQFRINKIKDVKLAKRLSEIFPDITFTSDDFDVCKLIQK